MERGVFEIEVIAALVGGIKRLRLQVEPGTTAGEAVQRSGLSKELPEATLANHGRLIDASTPLQMGDRVELLRPLTIDPKVSRRERVRQARARRPSNRQP